MGEKKGTTTEAVPEDQPKLADSSADRGDSPPVKKQARQTKPKKEKELATGGSTLRPVYGERRPVMYHLFESEMKSISAFNGEALRYFSFGSFLLSLLISLGIGAYFAPHPLPAAQATVVLYGLLGSGGLAAMCFGFGIWTLCTKKSVIDQIKKETKSDAG